MTVLPAGNSSAFGAGGRIVLAEVLEKRRYLVKEPLCGF